MQFLPTFTPLITRYDAFICDLWGVIHDGTTLYPGVIETLTALKNAGKKIIFLSNAPRRAIMAEANLSRLGIEKNLYDAVITSGEATYHFLSDPANRLREQCGKRYVFIGPERDAGLTAGLDYERVDIPAKADFILNVGFLHDDQTLDEWQMLLEQCLILDLPMLCANPDHEIVRVTGKVALCAGAIAARYTEMGGSVLSFGKPYPEVYAACYLLLKDTPKDRILAVGDNLATDIQGANSEKLPVALITGGILKTAHGLDGCTEASYLEIAALLKKVVITTDWVVPAFTL